MSQLPGLWKLVRPRQWIKNSFVLAPLVFAGEFAYRDAIGLALLAMVLCCVAAAAV